MNRQLAFLLADPLGRRSGALKGGLALLASAFAGLPLLNRVGALEVAAWLGVTGLAGWAGWQRSTTRRG